MSDKTIIFFLVLTIIMLLLIIMYQRFVFTRGIQTKLKQISEKLEEILEVLAMEKNLIQLESEINEKVKENIDKAQIALNEFVSQLYNVPASCKFNIDDDLL